MLDMKRIWMLRAAGTLCIIAGVSIVVIAGELFGLSCGGSPPLDAYTGLAFILLALPLIILLIIVGTVAIVGGIYALRRKNWGLALAGSILTLLSSVVLGIYGIIFIHSFVLFDVYASAGILAIIFVVLGKGEFKAKALVSALYREESADAHYKRGDAYDETGEYDKAITSYSKAIELDPNHALSYYNRGCAYGETGEYEKAIADFSKAVELDPNNASAYYNRGLAYYEKGGIPKAVSDLEKCIELSTDPGLIKDAKQALSEMGHSSRG
jgi:tetratricopeptide (TPR) repeat protein